jgi:hypothetical protein
MENIIKRWKELNLENAVLEFYCGGDSMGDTTWYLKNKEGVNVNDEEIESWLNDEVYNQVEFYVNSDGHYQGEAGTVTVELETNGDDEDFTFSKSSQTEWSESVENDVFIELTNDEVDFINKNVSNINGSNDSNLVFNYKSDFIMTDKLEEVSNGLSKKIDDAVMDYRPNIDDESELQDWYSFTTNDEGEELTIVDNELKIRVVNNVTEFRDE